MTEAQANYAVSSDIGTEYNFRELVEYKDLNLKLKKRLSWDEAEYVGKMLFGMYQQVQWAIGDFMIACVELFGEEAYQLDIFDTTENRRKKLKHIAERIRPNGRHEDLEFSYHEEVAYIDPIYHDEWLGKAKTEQLTVKQLHDALVEAGLKPKRKRKDPKVYQWTCKRCGTIQEILEDELKGGE